MSWRLGVHRCTGTGGDPPISRNLWPAEPRCRRRWFRGGGSPARASPHRCVACVAPGRSTICSLVPTRRPVPPRSCRDGDRDCSAPDPTVRGRGIPSPHGTDRGDPAADSADRGSSEHRGLERDGSVGGGTAAMGIDGDIGGLAGRESGAVRGGGPEPALTPHARRGGAERDNAVGGGAAGMASGRFIGDSGTAGGDGCWSDARGE